MLVKILTFDIIQVFQLLLWSFRHCIAGLHLLVPCQYLGLIYASVSADNVRLMVAARAYFIDIFIFCKKVRFFGRFFVE